MVGLEKRSTLDFVGVQAEWAVEIAAVNPDKLQPGLRAGIDLEKPLRGALQEESDLLPCLAHGAGVVGLAGVHVAGGTGVPRAGEGVFLERAFLEIDLASFVDDEHMDGPMFQPTPVDFLTGLFAGDAVAVVHYVENFFAHAASILQRSVNTSKLTFSARSCGEMFRVAKQV